MLMTHSNILRRTWLLLFLSLLVLSTSDRPALSQGSDHHFGLKPLLNSDFPPMDSAN